MNYFGFLMNVCITVAFWFMIAQFPNNELIFCTFIALVLVLCLQILYVIYNLTICKEYCVWFYNPASNKICACTTVVKSVISSMDIISLQTLLKQQNELNKDEDYVVLAIEYQGKRLFTKQVKIRYDSCVPPQDED